MDSDDDANDTSHDVLLALSAAPGSCDVTDQCREPALLPTRLTDYECNVNQTITDGCIDNNYGVT